MSTVTISGLDKATVLAAVFNASRPIGMGFLDPRSGQSMTVSQAAEILAHTPDGYFDYLHGRVMKVDLSSDDVDPWGYDRDNGEGAFAAAVEPLRAPAA